MTLIYSIWNCNRYQRKKSRKSSGHLY